MTLPSRAVCSEQLSGFLGTGLQAVRIALALAGDKSSARGGERGALPTTPKSGSSKVSLSRSRIGDDCFKNALGATLARHLGRTLQLYGDTTQEQVVPSGVVPKKTVPTACGSVTLLCPHLPQLHGCFGCTTI